MHYWLPEAISAEPWSGDEDGTLGLGAEACATGCEGALDPVARAS